ADVELADLKEVNEVLDGYSTELDRMLLDLAAEQIEYSRQFFRLHEKRGHWKVTGDRYALDTLADPTWKETFRRDRERVQRLHQSIRDLNRGTKAAIEGVIPAAALPAFSDAYQIMLFRN